MYNLARHANQMFSYKAEAPSGSPSEALSPCNGCPPYGVLVFWLLHCLSSPTFSTVQPQVIDVPIKTLQALQARSSVKSAPLKWILLRQMQRGRTASLSSLITLRIVAWDSFQKPISKYQLREASTYCARLWTKRTVQWNVQPSWKHITCEFNFAVSSSTCLNSFLSLITSESFVMKLPAFTKSKWH